MKIISKPQMTMIEKIFMKFEFSFNKTTAKHTKDFLIISSLLCVWFQSFLIKFHFSSHFSAFFSILCCEKKCVHLLWRKRKIYNETKLKNEQTWEFFHFSRFLIGLESFSWEFHFFFRKRKSFCVKRKGKRQWGTTNLMLATLTHFMKGILRVFSALLNDSKSFLSHFGW